MYRLIYFEPGAGYKTFDSESDREILESERALERQHIQVICVVDYRKQSISNKSLDFVKHTDGIDEIIFDPLYVNQF